MDAERDERPAAICGLPVELFDVTEIFRYGKGKWDFE